jgi:crotonobetainyl-CoA:carnitine CoA-transferase CaiB-like acyl-CoA transferase
LIGSQGFFERAFSLAFLPSRPEVLRGIRVLDLAKRIFGPATADFLFEFWAEGIKVELPGTCDCFACQAVCPVGRAALA